MVFVAFLTMLILPFALLNYAKFREESSGATEISTSSMLVQEPERIQDVNEMQESNLPSLNVRLSGYIDERDGCIAQRRSDTTSSGRGWDEWDRAEAEYRCSTVDLARKYFAEDPEGIIELCVHTAMIGEYTRDGGLGGNIDKDLIDFQHESGAWMDVTMDDAGNIKIGAETMNDWREMCKLVIDGVMERTSDRIGF